MAMFNLICVMLLLAFPACDGADRRYTHGSKKSFVRATFGGYDLPRDKITTTAAFKRHVVSHARCTGSYCDSNGGWSCPKGKYSGNCYNVEHIIDRHGSELNSHPECKDIPGNMIMAHGQWNQELGTLAQKYYPASTQEKTRVYGEDIMASARNSIRSCISKRYGRRAVEEDIYINITDYMFEDTDIGLLVIPPGANLTCIGCNLTTLECEDCFCDTCTIIEYVGNSYDSLVVVVLIGIILIPAIIGLAIGIIATISIIRIKKYVEAKKFKEISLEQMS